MKVKDFITTLSKVDPEAELSIDFRLLTCGCYRGINDLNLFDLRLSDNCVVIELDDCGTYEANVIINFS